MYQAISPRSHVKFPMDLSSNICLLSIYPESKHACVKLPLLQLRYTAAVCRARESAAHAKKQANQMEDSRPGSTSSTRTEPGTGNGPSWITGQNPTQSGIYKGAGSSVYNNHGLYIPIYIDRSPSMWQTKCKPQREDLLRPRIFFSFLITIFALGLKTNQKGSDDKLRTGRGRRAR